MITIEQPDFTGPERRFLFYSHDGLGLGHTRRNLAIAAALVEQCPEASVLLASGTDDAHRLGLPPRVEVLKLPGLRKGTNDQYLSRRLPVGTDAIRKLRSGLLEAAVRTYQPALVLVDKHPFGARGEFRAGLEALKEYGGQAVLGLRDILDAPAVVQREWAEHDLPNRIAAFYDRVLVYGDPAVFDLVSQYGLPQAVAQRTRYCGYVVNQDDVPGPESLPSHLAGAARPQPTVLATAGGGEDGFALLEKFIEASQQAPWQGLVIAGPMTPAPELETLRQRAAAAGVPFHTFVPRMPALFGTVDALVTMGGYNTLTEAAFFGMPTVCVPRVTPRSEQLIRAEAFERLGLLRMIHPSELSATTLAAAVRAAIVTTPALVRARAARLLSLDGARRAAAELLALTEPEMAQVCVR